MTSLPVHSSQWMEGQVEWISLLHRLPMLWLYIAHQSITYIQKICLMFRVPIPLSSKHSVCQENLNFTPVFHTCMQEHHALILFQGGISGSQCLNKKRQNQRTKTLYNCFHKIELKKLCTKGQELKSQSIIHNYHAYAIMQIILKLRNHRSFRWQEGFGWFPKTHP